MFNNEQGILKNTKASDTEEIKVLEQAISSTELFLKAVQEVVVASEVGFLSYIFAL
jgi:hypothetical protein